MNNVEDKLMHVTKQIEKQVDAAIEKIDHLDAKDLDALRKTRLKELREREEKRKVWLENGHGKYEELAEEKMFFDLIKKSENVVIHFFTNTNTRCPIVDMHLKKLAPKHLETRFVSLNAEKCPFLVERLKVKTIPTLTLIHNSVMVDKIVGFTQLGNRDDFSTEMLEWRIAQNSIIDYEGDLSVPPHLQESISKSNKKIRDGAFNDYDDELDELNEIVGKKMSLEDMKKGTDPLFLTAEEELELGLTDEK